MVARRNNIGSIVGGTLLIAFGVLALLTQLFGGFNFWHFFWPLIIVGVGCTFFAGMLAGGKSAAGLAIPGSILSSIGLMMFLMNLFGHLEAWAYGWTVIIMSVGVGIYIMGARTGEETQRRAGERVFTIGGLMFVIFGAFFETIFRSSGLAQFAFPVVLILVGIYLVVVRSGFLSSQKKDDAPPTDSTKQTGEK